jgi:chloramphenicol 3-O-phosphotransferase
MLHARAIQLEETHMNATPIVIISGPPGSGKSSVARRLAEQSPYERAVHVHTDDFYRSIRKGYVATWLPEAQEQNIIVLDAFAASATRYASGGYEVIVDGIIGPWYLDPWLKAVQDGWDVHFVVLRPALQTSIARAVAREPGALLNPEIVGKMWRYFAHLGPYESHVRDTSMHTLDESVAMVRTSLAARDLRLSETPI